MVCLKVLVTSDFHGEVESAEKIKNVAVSGSFDCIVVCGDLTDFGPVEVGRQLLDVLVGSKFPVLYVPGNMDPRRVIDGLGDLGFNLSGKEKIIEETAFIGVGYGLEKQLNQTIQKLKNTARFVVLVTHIPPYGTKVDLAWNGTHIGSFELRKFVEEHQPDVVLCGHVHEARGTDKIGKTLLCNPGPAFKGFYAELYLTDKIEVRFSNIR